MGPSTAEVEQLLQAARVHLAQGELQEAVERATQAIRLDDKQPAPYLVRAEAHRRLKRPEQALADLAVAIRLNPNQPGPYVIRAEVLKRRNIFDQAIADASLALMIDPRSAAAFAIRAECRGAIGDHDGAIEDVQEMVRIDPTRPVPDLRARPVSGAPTPAMELEDERFWKQSGRKASSDLTVFADGKPVDKTYRSRGVVSDEEAPEALGVASGYKPGTIGTPIPRLRGSRRKTAGHGGGAVLALGVAVVGAFGLWLAFRTTPEPSVKSATEPPSQVARSNDAAAPAGPARPSATVSLRPSANAVATSVPRDRGPRPPDDALGFNGHASEDRIVALWALSKAGRLTIELDQDRSLDEIEHADRLPQSNFHLLKIDLSRCNVSDYDVRMLSRLKHIEEINLWKTDVGDAAMAMLTCLSSLTHLTVQDTKVTDAGLSDIARLTNLRHLNLAGLSIGRRGLSQVGRLAQLEVLLLGGVQANDDAIGELGNLSNLRLLGLHFNKEFTNAAIPKLRKLQNLETIRLKDTRISDAVVKRYLPRCKIER
jgi:hypothetical protein